MKFPEKLKMVRRDQWVALLLAGILLAVVSLPLEKEESDAQQEETAKETEGTEEAEESVEEMERRLEEILSAMEGAGEVKVMITRKDDGEKIVEKDTPTVSRSTQEEADGGTSRSTMEEENDEATVYEKGESGEETPYVTKVVAPQIEGVLVLAAGGGDAVVEKNITDAVMALFGLEAHKIKVMKMTERSG